MNFVCPLTAYEVFAVGMVHRVAVGVAPNLKGATMAEKQTVLQHDLDRVRKRLVCGASDPGELIGVLVTEACRPEADVGVIYFVRQGYWAMCGSGTFALGVFLIESGIIEPIEPVTEITLELVTGLMKLRAEVDNGRVVRVATVTEPVFFVRSAEIELPGFGTTRVDISYCLNYFEPMVNARALGVDVAVSNRAELVRIGVMVREIVNATFEIVHPLDPAIRGVVQVQLYDPEPAVPGVDCVNVAIYGDDGFDLTPSGTSTCAHMATLHSKGALGVGEAFKMGSVTGALIEGKIIAESEIEGRQSIIPEIAGTAQVEKLIALR